MQYPQDSGHPVDRAHGRLAMPERPSVSSARRCGLQPLRALLAVCLSVTPLALQAMSCSLPSTADTIAAPSPRQFHAGSKFRLIEQSCAELAQTEPTHTSAAAASRSAQLALYEGGPVSGTLQLGFLQTSTQPLNEAPVAATTHQTHRASITAKNGQAGQTQRIVGVAATLSAAAERHDIDPLLLHAIAHVESRHNTQAVSPAGARGLMQVMPATAKRFGLKDPVRELMQAPLNVEASAAYLKTLQARFGNDLRLVLAAYNAGEGAVERHGRTVPPYAETRAYVQQVLGAYQGLRDWVAAAPSGAPATNTATR